jgi:N-acetyl sugar amidotransferase
MDTSDPEIVFHDNGTCVHCTEALERMRKQIPEPSRREEALSRLVATIKESGKGRECDCIIGVSGGVDSTTVAYHVKRLGLRALAVHFDNGWDSELAVDNIKRALDSLGIELLTHVVDWEEFRDVQLSFLRASVANCEIPTDHGITALLFRTAARHGVRHIISGSNLATEAIMPVSWGHYNQGLLHLRAVHRRFGTVPIRTLPTISLVDYLFYVFVRGIRQIPLLNYLEYDRERAKAVLASEIGWRDYGGKHFESVWTRFYQGHYLPEKFGFDKRRGHLSTMICSGQISREAALAELAKPPYPSEGLLREDMEFVVKKFHLSRAEWDAIMSAKPLKHTEFPSHYFLFHRMRKYKDMFRAIATRP